MASNFLRTLSLAVLSLGVAAAARAADPPRPLLFSGRVEAAEQTGIAARVAGAVDKVNVDDRRPRQERAGADRAVGPGIEGRVGPGGGPCGAGEGGSGTGRGGDASGQGASRPGRRHGGGGAGGARTAPKQRPTGRSRTRIARGKYRAGTSAPYRSRISRRSYTRPTPPGPPWRRPRPRSRRRRRRGCGRGRGRACRGRDQGRPGRRRGRRRRGCGRRRRRSATRR